MSPASVSRVLNHPEQVSSKLRTKVSEAVTALNYVPHDGARALVSRRTRTIGVVVPNISLETFAEMVQVLQVKLYEAKLQLILATSEYDYDREFEQARIMIERRVEGLILVGDERHQKLYDLIERAGIPFVNSFIVAPNEAHPYVGFDHCEASYDLTRQLIELGHREFAVITTPPENNDRVAARVAGIRSCLAENGIDLPASREVQVPFNLNGARMGFRSVVHSMPEATAVMCTTDVLGVGAIQEATAMGIAIPERFSVTGFDDLAMASHTHPSLTTIVNPAREIGRLCAEFLLAKIAGQTVPTQTQLEARIVIRKSTGRPYGD